MRNFSRYVSTLLVMLSAVFCQPAYCVPKAAVIRRDGSFVVEPKIGPIKALGDDWFVYSIPKKPGPGCFIWMVKPDGQKSLVSEPDGVEISCGRFEPGVAQVRKGKEGSEPEVVFHCSRKGKQGLINQHGKFILEPKYGYIGDIAEGHFVACEDSFPDNEKSQLLIFDENGVLTATLSGYSSSGRSRFSGGMAPVCDEHHKVGFVDVTGKLVVPCQYDEWTVNPYNGMYAVRDNNKNIKPFLIDRHGAVTKRPVIDADEYIPSGIKNAFLVETILSNKKYCGVTDQGNNVILPSFYDQIQSVPNGFLVKSLGRFYLFDTHGSKILDFPDNVEEVRVGREALIGVRVKGAEIGDQKSPKKPPIWGFINRSGQFVIEPRFFGVSAFEHNVAGAIAQDSSSEFKWGLIDETGKWVLKPIYDSVTPGKNLFSVIIPEQHFFSTDAWKENWDHRSDLQKLFRDKNVIGMARDELQKLIGQPYHTAFDYSSYIVGFGIDTADVIDFAFDKDSKVYRWRQRGTGRMQKDNKDFPAWTSADKYEF